MPRRRRRLRRAARRVHADGIRALRAVAGRKPRPRRARRAGDQRVLPRRRRGGRVDTVQQHLRDARFPAPARALRRDPRGRPLPRLAARPRVGVRAVDRSGRRVHRASIRTRQPDRPLPRGALLRLARRNGGGELRARLARRGGHEARPLDGSLAGQPRQRRPAARRRPARRVAGARHERVDGHLSPPRLRDRPRRGGDQRRPSPRPARAAPVRRPMRRDSRAVGTGDASLDSPRMPRLAVLLLSLTLGAGCAVLVSCGGDSGPGIPSTNADQIVAELERARAAEAAGDCAAVAESASKIQANIDAIDHPIEPEVKAGVDQGAQHLAELASDPSACQETSSTTSSTTTKEKEPTTTATPTTTTEETTTSTAEETEPADEGQGPGPSQPPGPPDTGGTGGSPGTGGTGDGQ